MTSLTAAAANGFRTSDDVPVTVLRPRRRGLLDLSELWRYRDLWWFLALRDIQVRYKQTALGAAWAVIQPVVMMIVFTGVFGRLMNVEAKVDVPYPIFVYAGLLPWTFFTGSVSASSNSLVANAHILRKIYFPRLLMPLAATGAPLCDYAIAFIVLMGLMIYYQVALSVSLLLLPLLILSTLIAALGVGVMLSALTVRYRDFRHVIPFMLQVWLFVTPVIYPLEITDRWQWLVNLNPMGGTISAFRAAVLGQPIDFGPWLMSTAVAAVVLVLGLRCFARSERDFADVV